jgi:hypothetical protein
MSHENRFFDEATETTHLAENLIVIRLRNLVDLDSELHVMNTRTQVGGTYRVVWLNNRAEEGFHPVGLELLEAEGEIWEPEPIPRDDQTSAAPPTALLECRRCHQQASAPLPEADAASLVEGFTIGLPCDNCKATTAWVFSVGEPVEPPPPSASASQATPPTTESAQKPRVFEKDERTKGRAPLNMLVKIARPRFGRGFADVCETLNVSRTGIYFSTEQGYEVGEKVEVVMPYHPDSAGIQVPGRIVRIDKLPGTPRKGVAIQLSGPEAKG